jgi:hypothetical protein
MSANIQQKKKQSIKTTNNISYSYTNASHVSHMSYHDFDASYVLLRNKIGKIIALHVGTHHRRSKTCVWVAHERFYKDVAHEPLHPAVPKDLMTHRASSSAPAMAPSHTTHSGGASSTSSSNTDFLKMFRGIFAMCHCIDLCMDVMEQRLQFVRRNQEIIHSQRNEPLLKFPYVPVFPPIPDPYASLTPAELDSFGIGPARVDNDEEEEEEANDDEETEDDE